MMEYFEYVRKDTTLKLNLKADEVRKYDANLL